MFRRLLAAVGVVTIVGVGAASVAALLTLRQKVHVSIAGETDAAKAGPDPVALLRDDVAGLRRDLAALTETLGKNFDALAAQGEADDAARRAGLEAAQAPLRADLAALRERVDAAAGRVDALGPATAASVHDAARTTDAAIADLATRLGRLEALVATRPAAPTAAPAAVAVAPPSPPAIAPTAPPAATPSAPALPPPTTPATSAPPATRPPDAAPPAAPPAAAAPRRKTFLAFSLPSQGADFSKVLRFEVLPDLSRVGFDAKSTLHAFSGVTSDVSGSFAARLTAPGTEVVGDVRARADTLDTGLVDRNHEMLGVLDTEHFPSLAFHVTSFTATSTDPKTLATTGTARGTLTVHGKSLDVAVPLRISVDDAKRVVVEGEVTVRLTDFGIPPPRKLVITVDDELKVWVALRARAVGAAP